MKSVPCLSIYCEILLHVFSFLSLQDLQTEAHDSKIPMSLNRRDWRILQWLPCKVKCETKISKKVANTDNSVSCFNIYFEDDGMCVCSIGMSWEQRTLWGNTAVRHSFHCLLSTVKTVRWDPIQCDSQRTERERDRWLHSPLQATAWALLSYCECVCFQY